MINIYITKPEFKVFLIENNLQNTSRIIIVYLWNTTKNIWIHAKTYLLLDNNLGLRYNNFYWYFTNAYKQMYTRSISEY